MSMISTLERSRDRIAEACTRHGVFRLHVFGSAVREDFRAGESDVDLLLELQPMDPFDRVDAYYSLRDELRAILGTNIDLVMVGAVKNRYMATEIDRTKQMLYAA